MASQVVDCLQKRKPLGNPPEIQFTVAEEREKRKRQYYQLKSLGETALDLTIVADMDVLAAFQKEILGYIDFLKLNEHKIELDKENLQFGIREYKFAEKNITEILKKMLLDNKEFSNSLQLVPKNRQIQMVNELCNQVERLVGFPPIEKTVLAGMFENLKYARKPQIKRPHSAPGKERATQVSEEYPASAAAAAQPESPSPKSYEPYWWKIVRKLGEMIGIIQASYDFDSETISPDITPSPTPRSTKRKLPSEEKKSHSK